jgi:hypothetical protein
LSSKRNNHIKANCVLIKEQVGDVDVKIKRCTAEKMWIVMHTKPKHGTPFYENRSMVRNVPVEYDDEVEWKNTNPLLLPSQEEHHTLPALEAYKLATEQSLSLIHHRSVLWDISPNNSSVVQASGNTRRVNLTTTKNKQTRTRNTERGHPPAPSTLAAKTPSGMEIITWADVAHKNLVTTPATSS